jgi:hypothetical protein
MQSALASQGHVGQALTQYSILSTAHHMGVNIVQHNSTPMLLCWDTQWWYGDLRESIFSHKLQLVDIPMHQGNE